MSIFQGDLIVRRALVDGMEDIRSNPWLLDDVFAQCAQEGSLKDEFGYKEIKRARDWFTKTDIPVVMDNRADDLRTPCITVHLGQSQEKLNRASLSDEGMDEDLDGTQTIEPGEVTGSPVIVAGPFTPATYDPVTGVVGLPDTVDTASVYAGQFVVDRHDGRAYEIAEVVDPTHLRIAAGVTTADFDGAVVTPQFSVQKLRRQLTYFDEVYQLGLHVHGDPAQLLWLYSIAVFILLRYKQALLEGKGFELSTFSATDMIRNEAFESEKVFSRYISLSGVVQHDWVEYVSPRVEGTVITGIVYCSAGSIPGAKTPDPLKQNAKDQGWGTTDEGC